MSRAIKFRTWADGTRTMTDPQYVLSQNTIMQFTGLLDRNGKEIYEGDIVHSLEHDCSFVVFWCDGQDEHLGNQLGWFLEHRYQPDVVRIIGLEAHLEIDENGKTGYFNGEIIGNIYQNPELLNIQA